MISFFLDKCPEVEWLDHTVHDYNMLGICLSLQVAKLLFKVVVQLIWQPMVYESYGCSTFQLVLAKISLFNFRLLE